jgi:hypothetical protein
MLHSSLRFIATLAGDFDDALRLAAEGFNAMYTVTGARFQLWRGCDVGKTVFLSCGEVPDCNIMRAVEYVD